MFIVLSEIQDCKRCFRRFDFFYYYLKIFTKLFIYKDKLNISLLQMKIHEVPIERKSLPSRGLKSSPMIYM